MTEPQIAVGILSGKEIQFSFPDEFISSDGIAISGIQQAVYRKGKIYWQEKEYDELSFIPRQNTSSFFELQDVTIGINFHWERKEVQRFKGELKIIVEDDKLTAINIISIENYLTSVISSEMSATASLELLKAHAVISRSWLLNKLKIENEKLKNKMQPDSAAISQFSILNSQFIKWYDHEAHKNFDVCADDHCQRYQGITRASTSRAIEAVSATRGEVLMYEGKICDARFSKCCGGAFEEFQNCWENVRHPYLIGQRDSQTENKLPDLTVEVEADKWIRTSPVAFCNTQDKEILSQVLNNYDQETADFYR
ncbi:SpoIID/LytB domain-containing protein, partial [Bacteroides acidifaciens]